MKKINESVRIDCRALVADPEFSYMDEQLNDLRDYLQDNGAVITGDDADMIISGLSFGEVSDLLFNSEFDLDLSDLQAAGYADVEEDDEYMNESDEFCEDVEFDDDEQLNDDESLDEDMWDNFDDYDSEDYVEFDDDDVIEYDDMEDDMLCDDDDDFCGEIFNEDDEFMECLSESYNKRKSKCCPPVHKRNMSALKKMNESKKFSGKKHGKLVNLHESLNKKPKSIRKENLSINEAIYNKAVKKLKVANKKANNVILEKRMGTEKYNTVMKALKEGKTSLYTKKRINGKHINELSTKELYKLLKEVTEQVKTLNKKVKSVNESASTKKVDALKEALEQKKRLLHILDEELTYRLVVKEYLNEDEEPSTTEETTEETSEESTDEESTETDPEQDEEVELTRVIITVANQAAADDLKSELVDAGIPEDAIEFETEDEEDVEEPDEESTEETAETEETEESSDEESTEDTNESLHINVFKRLLEDEETDTESTNDEEASEESDEESTEETDDTPVKVILTNTDYIQTLAQVLNDVYGIEQEEFEEMIGGAIVDDESSDDTEEDSEETSDEESSEEPSSKGDDAIDNMSDEDLAQLFGESTK